ncbi:hypothetical protein BDZ97DRAFT_1925220 [Flammula alnicola]|nr:hypothetical protein BDZ97DRAFT_1925220 [Flammula alnicola]
MANQINIYDNEHYLDHIADKWRKMGYITPGMPTYAAYSFAFSYEHPNEGAQNRITNLTNFIRAHAARAGNTGTVVHAYSIAYGSNIPVTYGISEEVTIPDAYGTSAANIDTRPKVRDRKAEHAFRATLAYHYEPQDRIKFLGRDHVLLRSIPGLTREKTLSTPSSTPSGHTSNQAEVTESASVLPEGIASACSQLVEGYRTGHSEKIDTLVEIQKILSNHAAGKENQTELVKQALGSYLDMLDNHDSVREAALDQTTTQPIGPDEHVPNPDDNRAERVPGSHESEADGSKRSRSPDSEAGPDNPNPKRRIDPGQFSWVIREELEPSPLSPELRKTQSMLENFARDPKFAKASLPVKSGSAMVGTGGTLLRLSVQGPSRAGLYRASPFCPRIDATM